MSAFDPKRTFNNQHCVANLLEPSIMEPLSGGSIMLNSFKRPVYSFLLLLTLSVMWFGAGRELQIFPAAQASNMESGQE